jgi:CSLREA domain-containing protein
LLALAGAALASVVLATPALAATITVTTSDDDLTANDGTLSLREAITAINAGNDLGDPDVTAQNPGTFGTNDTINFNIPGNGRHVIAVGTAASAQGTPLPQISKRVSINATTQGPYAGVPMVALDGSSAGTSGSGLRLSLGSSNSSVRGLDIFSFRAYQIQLGLTAGTTIAANDIGFDTSGAPAPSIRGVFMTFANNNVIGGTTAADRNVISGNLAEGVLIDQNASHNVVQGNFIGTDVQGKTARGNALLGPAGEPDAAVHVFGDANTIGGTAAGAGNLISGNGGGILVDGGQTNTIQGNLIGTVADGTKALPNSGAGIAIADSASQKPAQNNQVGGTPAGAGNTIAFNSGAGVVVTGGDQTTGNSILGNSIFSNGVLGIDLGGDGVTQNSAGSQGGPNAKQSFPVIAGAETSTSATALKGSLDSTPSTQFRLEFFATGTCDPSGFGQGLSFIGSTAATTDAAGHAAFALSLPAVLTAGTSITATATGPSGNTSEFSACFKAAPPPAPVPGPDVTHLTQSAKTWRESNALPSAARVKKPPVGTTFRFDLNVAAKARLAFARLVGGRRVAGKCVRQTSTNKRKPKCTRALAAGHLDIAAHAGTNKVRFQGRISAARKLKPGRYKLTVTATDAIARASAPRSLTFTIAKPG